MVTRDFRGFPKPRKSGNRHCTTAGTGRKNALSLNYERALLLLERALAGRPHLAELPAGHKQDNQQQRQANLERQKRLRLQTEETGCCRVRIGRRRLGDNAGRIALIRSQAALFGLADYRLRGREEKAACTDIADEQDEQTNGYKRGSAA